MAKSHDALIRFAGPPANLAASVRMPRTDDTVVPYVVMGGERLPLRVSGAGDNITELAFSLPADTPPGPVKGSVVVAGKRLDALAEVELRTRIQVQPAAIGLKARPGDTVTVTLNVANCGNGDLEFAAGQTVTLRPSGTLARGVRSAFRKPDRDFAERVIALGEDVAAAPSHELTLSGEMATTTLRTGGQTSVRLELGIPAGLPLRSSWTGSMALLGKRVRIDVEASPG